VNFILESVTHKDAISAANGYQSLAEPDGKETRNYDGGCNLLALICGALCKKRNTPQPEMFAQDTADIKISALPLMAPIGNGK
jgi:hypothetical protein